LFEGDALEGSAAAKLLELLSDDWPDEGEGNRNGVVVLLFSDIDAAITITFEIVGFKSLYNEGDVHDKSRPLL
jgi:hypothetical protein